MSLPTLMVEARGKVNSCLLLGPLRDDGYHEVATVIVPVDLADTVTLSGSDAGADEVVCPGVEGDNLASRALALFRERSGWDGPAVRITIDKRIPVAAGMAGGSADAAAALRLVAAAAGVADSHLIGGIAPLLGADVPAMVDGRTVLALGTGTELEPLPAPADCGLLVLPAIGGLATPAVFAQAGGMGLRRPAPELERAASLIRAAAASPGWELPGELLGVNDLGAASAELSGEVGAAITEATGAGADSVFVTGSGPTVVGLFAGADGQSRAAAAAAGLSDRAAGAIACSPSPGSATIEESR